GAYVPPMRLLIALIVFMAAAAVSSVRAEDRPVTTNRVHRKEQQFEKEVKTESDRPNKKERARAAEGRAEDGVREFGRGLRGGRPRGGRRSATIERRRNGEDRRRRSRGDRRPPPELPGPGDDWLAG